MEGANHTGTRIGTYSTKTLLRHSYLHSSFPTAQLLQHNTVMSLKITIFWSLVCVHFSTSLIVQPEWKIYYDLHTNRTIDSLGTSNPRLQLYRQRQLRIGFGPIPCRCEGLSCGCCAGMNIQAASFNHRACMNFTYVPKEFGINMALLMDDSAVVNRTMSAKNPPPICMPAPLPPLLPSVDFCVRLFNIHTESYNIFTCIDFETRIERAPILILHFDCLEMGMDGISQHKPEEFEYEMQEAGSGEQEDVPIEVYDEVVEEDTGNATIALDVDATTQGPK